MEIKTMVEQNRDSVGWAIVGAVMALGSSGALIRQIFVGLGIPLLAVFLIHILKRELNYRLPPRRRKRIKRTRKAVEEDLDKSNTK